MQFLLNGKPCLSPSVLLKTCEDNSIDVSEWFGKANSFVDCHGIDPSYGYFLVDNTLRLELIAISDDPNAGGSGAYEVAGGSNKATLTIQFDDGSTTRDIQDLYLRSIVNVTPSLSSQESVYFIKLEDARFVFSEIEASEKGTNYRTNNQFFNEVETFLTAEQLEAEYDLDSTPEMGHFIYDFDTVEPYHIDTPSEVEIGTTEGVAVKIDAPISWEEIFTAIFTNFCDVSRAGIDPVFPYWELNDYTLTLNFESEIFPDWIPQNISMKDRSARDVIYELLFWSGTSLRYDGEGVFTFFKVGNELTTGGSNQLDDYLVGLNPFEIKHTTLETGSEIVPEGLTIHVEYLDQEREDNTKSEYHKYYMSLDGSESPPDVPRGRKNCKVRLPIIHIEERNTLLSPSDTPQLAGAEYYAEMNIGFSQLWYRYFLRYPSYEKDFGGFIYMIPQSFLDRISWYSLGGQPGTKIESKLPFDWGALNPPPVIPRELKLSVIIAKVENQVSADDVVFTFIEPRLLVGQLFDTNSAYNTIHRSYEAGEEVILIGGNVDEWRHNSLLLENYDQSQLYFTIDDIPYLRLKVSKDHLIPIGSDINLGWKVLLDNVAVVNGKLPQPDEDEEEEDYIYIKNSPRITLDDDDEFIYVGYDHLAGSDVYHRWTVADSQNDVLFLKGLPGYEQNPVEPSEGERRLVLKSPYSATEAIGWLEEAADGRTDEELEDFIIQVILEQGGTGGGGGSTMLKALVNQPGGRASTDATLNWDGGVALVSDGTAQPDSGAADNTFSTPFLDNEPILLIKKNNGVWTAIKIQENIIRGYPLSDVLRDSTDFTINLVETIQGTVPTGTLTAKGNGFEYASNEQLAFKHGNDGLWHIIERYETTGIFRTQGVISAAAFNNTSGVLTIGSGSAKRMSNSLINPSQYSVLPTEAAVTIKNMAKNAIGANKNIQCKRIGRYWFVDVEDCG